MKTLNIDIETFSPENLTRTGTYKYAAHEGFQILLFAYSIDRGPVHVIDLANGEPLPVEIERALTDPTVEKWAWNAAFERVCLSAHLGTTLDPAQWRCSMIWSATLGLPLSLDHAGAVLGVEQPKMVEGKRLIKKFCVPGTTSLMTGDWGRTLPTEAPTDWETFKAYNQRDVEVELQIQDRLKKHPVPNQEWDYYTVDQHINDLGIGLDPDLIIGAIKCDRNFREQKLARARELTSLDNPNSPIQLQEWLTKNGLDLPSLTKADVTSALSSATGDVKEALELRQELSRSSVKKYQAMVNAAVNTNPAVAPEVRAHGLLQFYGAGRTGRWAGRLIQVQNLPRNYMPDLDQARSFVADGDHDILELLYPSVTGALSELIRTAFIPTVGHEFVVADFSAIEARVLAWLAGEQWRLDLFADGGDIYCQSAAKMFGVPVEKNGVNADLRQKGKVAELACGYGGSIGALKAMGAIEMGLDEAELQPIVTAWREANPNITTLWWDIDQLIMETVQTRATTSTRGLTFSIESGILFITLPSGRRLAYVKPRIGTNKFGGDCVTYAGVGIGRKWERIDSYGPKFVENIIQAISRDLLAHALKTVHEAGHRIVMHVHDEIVIETPRHNGASVDDIVHLMCDLPDWAEGLRMDADGFTCDFYQKD